MKEELLVAWSGVVSEKIWHFGAAGVLALALIGFEVWGAGASRQTVRRWRWFFLTSSVLVGLWFGWSVLWLADDAFISFRYAANFADGKGLVFNPGEWVEGYTNFLWTFGLGVMAGLGASIPHVALFGNLASFAACLVVASEATKVASPGGLVPFASIMLAGSFGFYEFASSGLETMPVALLLVTALWASTRNGGALWAGLLLTASVLCRPDQVILWATMGVALVLEDILHGGGEKWSRRLDWRRYLAFVAPFLLIYGVYFLWRWKAYGDILPNTFYAKASGLYFEQGSFYILHGLMSTGGWLWGPALGLALYGPIRSRHETRYRLFACLGIPSFCIYVAAVGGDFMEHRFLVPLMPIAFSVTEVGLRWKSVEVRRKVSVAAVAVLALTVSIVPMRLIEPLTVRWNLAAEHSFYQLRSVFPISIESPFWERGKRFHDMFKQAGGGPRLATTNIGIVSYLSELPIVDMWGLTNKRIGRKPIEKRGRPGHERFASIEDLLVEDAIITTELLWPQDLLELSMGVIGENPVFFVQYHADVMRALSGLDDVILPSPEEDIEWMIENDLSSDALVRAIGFYKMFLGHHPEKEALISKLETRLKDTYWFGRK